MNSLGFDEYNGIGWWWMTMVFATGATSSGLKTTDRLVRIRAMSLGPANTRVLRCCCYIYIMSYDVFVKHINSWVVFITDVRPPNKWKMFSRSSPVHLDPLCRHNHFFNPVRISTAQAQADNISNISNRPSLIFLEQIIISNIPWAQVLKLKDFHFLLASF